ncbi:hypothetical protein [Streptococcus danieliae]|nr:hypothetical protein [Streptococcus danieliae]MCU0081908.1 hypothetical protein [Streptococcus danieliae]
MEFIDNMKQDLLFEEIDSSELNGNGRDFVDGFIAGLTIVGLGVTLT